MEEGREWGTNEERRKWDRGRSEVLKHFLWSPDQIPTQHLEKQQGRPFWAGDFSAAP